MAASNGRMTRRDERAEPAEQIAQREHNQSRGDGLRADHLSHLADAALSDSRDLLDPVRRLLNAAREVSWAAPAIAARMPSSTNSLMICLPVGA